MLNTVLDYMDRAVQEKEDSIAIVDSETRISYKEYCAKALSIATWIIEYTDGRNKPVIVMMKNSYKALLSFWGVSYSGNAYVPLDINLPIERIKNIEKILNPLLVIVCDDRDDGVDFGNIFETKVIRFEEVCANESCRRMLDSRRRKIIDTDPVYILFTSGSTGSPKGVVINHRAVIDFVEEASEEMNFDSEEIFLNQAPFYFDASVPDIFCSVRNQAELHLVDKSFFAFPIKLMQYIEKEGITAIFWVPSALSIVVNMRALGKNDISSLKKIMFCGEVMPTRTLNKWKEVLPDAKYVNYYGPCEATYACTYYVIDKEFGDDEALPIGRAAKNTDIMILDDNRLVCEANIKGELCIRGSSLAMGYYNDPEKTAASFVQNPLNTYYPERIYRTGDIAHYDDEGLIIYDGRKDFQIKYKGYRIELGEIETALGALEGIEQVACIYKSESEKIELYYVGSTTKERIIECIKSKLPYYMVPHNVISLPVMPMNANGKINRKLLMKEV